MLQVPLNCSGRLWAVLRRPCTILSGCVPCGILPEHGHPSLASTETPLLIDILLVLHLLDKLDLLDKMATLDALLGLDNYHML